MADSIFAKATSLTIVKTSDGDKKNLVAKFKVGQVEIGFKSRPMRHMREDGVSIVDARIIDSTIVDINVFCTTLDEIKMLNSILEDRQNTYTVSSRGLIFRNMTMFNKSIKQDAEMLTASPVRFSMKQLKKEGGDEVVIPIVEQPPDSSLIGGGVRTVTKALQSLDELIAKVLRG